MAGKYGRFSFGAPPRPKSSASASTQSATSHHHQTQPQYIPVTGVRKLIVFRETLAETVRHDFFEERPLWPFSCYAPFPKMRSECGSDTSFEELRYHEMKLIKIDRKPIEDVSKQTSETLEQVKQRTQSYYNQKCGQSSEHVGNQMLLIKRGPQLSHRTVGVQSGSEGGAMSARSSQPETSFPPGLGPQSLDVHFEDNVNPPSEREFALDAKDNPWLADEFETIPDQPPPDSFC